MPPLTWRNVDAPDYGAALSGLGQAGDRFIDAGASFAEAGRNIHQQQRDQASAAFMAAAARYPDRASFDRAMADGTLTQGMVPGLMNEQATATLLGRSGDLLNNQVAEVGMANDTARVGIAQGTLDLSRDRLNRETALDQTGTQVAGLQSEAARLRAIGDEAGALAKLQEAQQVAAAGGFTAGVTAAGQSIAEISGVEFNTQRQGQWENDALQVIQTVPPEQHNAWIMQNVAPEDREAFRMILTSVQNAIPQSTTYGSGGDFNYSGLPAAGGGSATGGSTGALFGSLEQQHNLPPGLMDTMWAIESGRGANQENVQGSGASGHFQWMPGTEAQYGVQVGNLESEAAGAAQFAADNAAYIVNGGGGKPGVGRPLVPYEYYLAHQQGLEGARALLTADPNASAASIVGADSVTMNGGTADMTVSQFLGVWENRFNEESGGGGGGQVGPTRAAAASGQMVGAPPSPTSDFVLSDYQQDGMISEDRRDRGLDILAASAAGLQDSDENWAFNQLVTELTPVAGENGVDINALAADAAGRIPGTTEAEMSQAIRDLADEKNVPYAIATAALIESQTSPDQQSAMFAGNGWMSNLANAVVGRGRESLDMEAAGALADIYAGPEGRAKLQERNEEFESLNGDIERLRTEWSAASAALQERVRVGAPQADIDAAYERLARAQYGIDSFGQDDRFDTLRNPETEPEEDEASWISRAWDQGVANREGIINWAMGGDDNSGESSQSQASQVTEMDPSIFAGSAAEQQGSINELLRNNPEARAQIFAQADAYERDSGKPVAMPEELQGEYEDFRETNGASVTARIEAVEAVATLPPEEREVVWSQPENVVAALGVPGPAREAVLQDAQTNPQVREDVIRAVAAMEQMGMDAPELPADMEAEKEEMLYSGQLAREPDTQFSEFTSPEVMIPAVGRVVRQGRPQPADGDLLRRTGAWADPREKPLGAMQLGAMLQEPERYQNPDADADNQAMLDQAEQAFSFASGTALEVGAAAGRELRDGPIGREFLAGPVGREAIAGPVGQAARGTGDMWSRMMQSLGLR